MRTSTSDRIPSISKEEGFTLVELLVVIAIIAVLTAIAVPAFINQRQKSIDASVLSDVKNIATVVNTALIDCPDADVFQFVIDSNTRVPVTVEQPDGSMSSFDSWHTIASTSPAVLAGEVNVKVYNFARGHEQFCISEGVTISKGNYLHLTEVPGFETNRFLIHGWNKGGAKYDGKTVAMTHSIGALPDEALNSTAVYDSLSGGIVK